MSENLRKKTLSGVSWGYVDRFGSQLLFLLTGMVLARLLTPEEYGIIAMAYICQGFASIFSDIGFTSALIQKKEIDALDTSTVYWTNLALCLLSAVALIALAPYGADFFNEERLTSIIQVSALTIPIGAIGGIHTALFTKEMIYKKPIVRGIIVKIASAALGIYLALNGFGVWALVYQGLFTSTAITLSNWIISSWRPQVIFSFERLKPLFRYGSKMYASGILDFGFNKVYDIIIGKFYSPVQLSLYNRANSTANIFKDSFFGVLSGVTFPLFVKMQDDDFRLRLNIRRFMMIITMVLSIVMFSLIALGQPLFTLLFSSKWDAAIPYFKFSCFLGFMYPLHAINLTVLQAKGRSDLFLQLEIIKKVLTVVVVAASFSYGVLGLFWGMTIHSIACLYINCHYTKMVVDYSIKDQLKDILPYVISSATIALVVWGVDRLFMQPWLSTPIWSTKTTFSLVDELIAQSHNALRLLVGFVIGFSLFISYHRTCRTYAYTEAIRFMRDTVGEKRIFKLLLRRQRPNNNLSN